MRKLDLKNIDIRKFLGTIIGGIFFVCCILYFTYAYYEWKSESTNITLGMQDLSVECLVGADVNVTNIGPVLNYQDGVKSEFSINNQMNEDMAIDLRLDIESISDNLKVESFKYALVTDTTGGTTYDYNNPVLEGDFRSFEVGSNIITTSLAVSASITQYFQFIIYIDGNMYNNSNMMENSLVANLMIGNCDENSVPLDSLIYQAIYSETDNSLTFTYTKPLKAGDTYNNKAVTAVYTGFTTNMYSSSNGAPWNKDGNYKNITTVDFETVIKPKSTAYWFTGFEKLTSINLKKLDTSNVTDFSNMFSKCTSLINLDLSSLNTNNLTDLYYTFSECTSLVNLDLSNFNTSKVTRMYRTFYSCSSLTELDVSNFDTKNVVSMYNMFSHCQNLLKVDLSNWDTSSVTNMSYMFNHCYKLIELDVSNWDTSSVTNMGYMFNNCKSLTSLDISNFNTSKVTNMSYMFSYCSELKNLNINLNSFDTSSVTNMNYMFYDASNLTVTIIIKNTSITYTSMFGQAATEDGTQITVNYVGDNPTTADVNESTESLVNSMVATGGSNVVSGGCVGDYCSV